MKKRYSFPLWLIGVIVLLVAARIALPFVVRDQLNSRMAEMGDEGQYSGHIEKVSIALWRGAYTLHEFRIDKTTDEVDIPFFHGPATDISLAWRHLIRGRVVGDLELHSPDLNFLDGRDETDTQAGEGVDWRDTLNNLAPFEFNEIIVNDGRIRFQNLTSQPPVDVAIEDLQARLENLGNVERKEDSDGRVATLEAEAMALGSAPVELRAEFDPIGRTDDFELLLRLTEVQLVELNDLAREYAALDFESGYGEFVMELQARDGRLEGYAKPLFQDMQIFSWESDVVEGDSNPLRIAWEATAEVVTSIFQNQPEQQFATRVPIQGDIDDRELGVLPAIGGILRNAFIEAYRADFEGLGPRPDDGD